MPSSKEKMKTLLALLATAQIVAAFAPQTTPLYKSLHQNTLINKEKIAKVASSPAVVCPRAESTALFGIPKMFRWLSTPTSILGWMKVWVPIKSWITFTLIWMVSSTLVHMGIVTRLWFWMRLRCLKRFLVMWIGELLFYSCSIIRKIPLAQIVLFCIVLTGKTTTLLVTRANYLLVSCAMH